LPLGMPGRRFALLWLLGSLVTVFLLAAFTATELEGGGWHGYLRLSRGSDVTEGTVVRVDSGNHCRADYSYQVSRVTYYGTEPDCSARVEDRVVVTYDRADPRLSCLGQARDHLLNELIPMALAGVAIPPFIILTNLATRRWRDDEKGAASS
jgi:Protein of unknown function (DUF3592)